MPLSKSTGRSLPFQLVLTCISLASYDSQIAQAEADFARVRAEELEKAWWSEQGELRSGPAAAGKNAVPEDEAASTKWQVHLHRALHNLLSTSL